MKKKKKFNTLEKKRKDTCISIFIETLFTIAKIWKQPKFPLTDKWIKIYHLYINIYIKLLSNKKE